MITVDTILQKLHQGSSSDAFTIGVNQDRLLVVSISTFKGAVSAMTYGGQALTRIGFADPGTGSCRSEMWYLIAPPTGANTLAITASSGVWTMSTFISLYGANQTAQPHTSTTATGSTNQISASVTTTIPNTLLIDAIAAVVTVTKGASQTVLGQQQGQNQFSYQHQGASDQSLVSAGAGTMIWALSSAAEWESVVAAFAPAPTHTQVGFTAKMKIVNTTKNFTAKMRLKKSIQAGFTAQMRLRSNAKGPLADLQYRSIDMMKWTKDTENNQPSDTSLANIVSVMQKNFNLTHIACTLNIDPTTFYPTSFVPSPRSVAGFYKAVTDAIHNVGLRVLHRPASFAMEGDYSGGANHFVGGSRYPQGSPTEIIPALGTFTDNFNRANVYTSIIQNLSTFSDNFNRASLGSTDWLPPIGAWSIVSNELVNTGNANASSNTVLTKVTYNDFTLQAKVKRTSTAGFNGIAIRMRQSSTIFPGRSYCNFLGGYVVELRGTNEIRIEDIATASLATATFAGGFTSGSYYQVKVIVTGNNIQVKVWADGTTEPSTFNINYTDTSNRFTTGSVGFVSENAGASTPYDDLTISFSPTTTTVSDWNQIGTWGINNGALVGTSAGPQYANLLYSKNKYTNFTMTTRIKSIQAGKGGVTSVIFRGNAQTFGFGFTAYTARITNNTSLQLEDMSLTDLVTVSKSFLADTWYKMKIVCTGAHIQIRVWPDDGTSEPSTWEIDYTDPNNRYPTGSVGYGTENIQNQMFDDFSIQIASNYNSWLGIVYQFIVNNPGVFMNGDIWAPFPERTQGIFSDSTSFIANTGAGVQTNYATFFNDLKAISDYAFSQINLVGVITGWTGNNYSEVRSGWVQQSIFDTAKVTSWDYYQNYSGDVNFTGARAKFDLDAAYSLHGNWPIIWQEWGPTPDMLNNISSTTGQSVNGYGNVVSPNPNFAQNREVYIRDFYTNCLVAALTDGKLKMFNYWGFWDTGNNDTGIALISGTTTDINNIKLRREGWILSEYFQQGPHPRRSFQAQMRLNKSTQVGFTARISLHARQIKQVGFTAKMRIYNNILPTIWTPENQPKTTWSSIDNLGSIRDNIS